MQVFILPILGIVIVGHYEKVISLSVIVRIVQDALSLFPIPSTSSAFLHVPFE